MSFREGLHGHGLQPHTGPPPLVVQRRRSRQEVEDLLPPTRVQLRGRHVAFGHTALQRDPLALRGGQQPQSAGPVAMVAALREERAERGFGHGELLSLGPLQSFQGFRPGRGNQSSVVGNDAGLGVDRELKWS